MGAWRDLKRRVSCLREVQNEFGSTLGSHGAKHASYHRAIQGRVEPVCDPWTKASGGFCTSVRRKRSKREGLAATEIRRRKESAGREGREGAVVRERKRKGARVRVLGKMRERIWVAIVGERESEWKGFRVFYLPYRVIVVMRILEYRIECLPQQNGVKYPIKNQQQTNFSLLLFFSFSLFKYLTF